jgi:mitofilin
MPGAIPSDPLVTAPSDPVVEASNIPKLPPSPEDVGAAPLPDTSKAPTPLPPMGTGTATVAPPAGTSPKKKTHRMRNSILNLILLSVLGFGAGTYYSLVNDNFHDFFTEYIPGGEDAVAYFEEREFKKRFPKEGAVSRLHQQIRGESKVKIPGRGAGASVKTAEDSTKATDLGARGPHLSAVDEPKPPPTGEKAPPTHQPESKSQSHNLLPTPEKPATKPAEKAPAASVPPEPIKTEAPKPITALKPIDHLNIENASEPVIQDVVKILNDIITVINADGAASKFETTIGTAKSNLSKIVADINNLKSSEQKSAEDKIRSLHAEFDEMAKELVRRQQDAIQNQEIRWKEEYESEQAKLKEAYEHKVKSELEEAQKVYEQKLKNELLEQQIALHRNFTSTVKDRVESERSGRLSKLGELSSSVSELEKLTGEWNTVVDANLRTQHLLVAVEAVKSALENADRPRPFIEELAALKEVAADDPVVNAAIASINPIAYQRGIPTSGQLVDRFRRVAFEVRKASLLPENAGVASHAASLVLSKVMFKKSGLPVGEDVESVLTRTEVLLEEGNLDLAAREMNSLSGWAKTLSRDWLGEVRKVLEVKQALDVSFSPSP